jgi:hypothetical protein
MVLGMRSSFAIAGIVLIAGIALACLQWQVRAAGAARIIAPASLASLEFKTLLGEGHWMPIAPEDAPGMVASFNLNRRLLARMPLPLAIAPVALLRQDGRVEEWYLTSSGDPLLEKYTVLSLRDEVANAGPTIAARQLRQPGGGEVEIIVTDPHATAPTVVAFARKAFYDEKLKSYRYGEGTPVRLMAAGAAGRFRGTFEVGEVVHQGTVTIEYTYNDLPESHNDYTRMVSCQVTMLYH